MGRYDESSDYDDSSNQKNLQAREELARARQEVPLVCRRPNTRGKHSRLASRHFKAYHANGLAGKYARLQHVSVQVDLDFSEP